MFHIKISRTTFGSDDVEDGSPTVRLRISARVYVGEINLSVVDKEYRPVALIATDCGDQYMQPQ